MRLIVVALVAVLATGALVYSLWYDADAEPGRVDPSRSLEIVARGPLRIAVTQEGTLRAANTQKLRHFLEGQATVAWVIDEGKAVKQGDVVIRFEDKQLKQQLDQAERKVQSATTARDVAKEAVELLSAEQATEAEKFALAFEAAKLELTKYSEGEAGLKRRERRLAVEQAEATLERESENYAAMPKLLEEGFVTKAKVEEHRIAVAEAEVAVQSAKLRFKNFEKYEHPNTLAQKQNAVKEAGTAVEQSKRRHASALNQSKAEAADAENERRTAIERRDKLKDQLGKTVITAPCDGVLHYGDPVMWWMGRDIRVGSNIWQGMTVANIPDLSKFVVEVLVPEVDVPRLVEGQSARVSFKSLPGVSLGARVVKVHQVADRRASRQGVKKFKVELELDGVHPQLKPGLSAKAEIEITSLTDVLTVSAQSVLRDGKQRFVHVGTPEQWTRRDVTIGLRTATRIEITQGLDAGDQVLLFDPRAPKADKAP